MLYPTAAYLVTFKMVLLFATSEADLDSETKTLGDLIRNTEKITLYNEFDRYLTEIARNGTLCKRMLEKIDDFLENFRNLLNETELQKYEGFPNDFIPMFDKFTQLRALCSFQPERPTKRHQASTSGSDGADVRDEHGFRIKQGKQEVKLLLDVFLQLSFDEKCKDIQSLANFANSLLGYTKLYFAVLGTASNQAYKSTIMSHIDKYAKDYQKVPYVDDYDNKIKPIPIELIPMREILKSIRQRCVRPDDTSPNPLEDTPKLI